MTDTNTLTLTETMRAAIGALVNEFGERQWQSGRGLSHKSLEDAFEAIIDHATIAAPVQTAVQTAAQYLSGSDMADLRQLDEEFSAGGGWCLPKARMKRLAELGVIRHGGGGHYSITSFGSLILGGEFFRLPLETVEECNARIGKEHTAITAQQGGGT